MKRFVLALAVLLLALIGVAAEQNSSFDEAPLIFTEPPTTVAPWGLYMYRVEALDLQEDPICWRLVDGPSGAFLFSYYVMPEHPYTYVMWPARVDSGEYKFRIVADDCNWHYDTQKWRVQVEVPQ